MAPKKATPEQYKKLLDLIQESPCLKWGKGTPEAKREAWVEKVAAGVNALGGVEKTYEGWKKAFTEWKSHAKGKIRAGKPLSETEKRCAEATALFASCQGMASLPELGVPASVGRPELAESLICGPICVRSQCPKF